MILNCRNYHTKFVNQTEMSQHFSWSAVTHGAGRMTNTEAETKTMNIAYLKCNAAGRC